MRKNIAFPLSFLVMTAQLLLPVQVVAAEDYTLDELMIDVLTDVSDASDDAAGHDTAELPENAVLFENPADVQDEDSALLFEDFQELEDSQELGDFQELEEFQKLEDLEESGSLQELDDLSAQQSKELPEGETEAEEEIAEEEIAKEEITEEEIAEEVAEQASPAMDDFPDDPNLPFICLIEADGTVSITGFTGTAEGDLTIPDKIAIGGKDYSVSVISAEAFKDKTGFTGTLTIPATVTDIRHDAFSGCQKFTSLVFAQGSGLTTIGKNAFYNCSGFKNAFSLPDTVTSIGEAAFKNCRGFTGSWSLPASLVTLEKDAFSDCCNIGGTLTIPAGVVEIGDYAFYMSNGHYSGWNGVGGLSFAEGSAIERIGKKAFYGNWYLTGGLRFPDSLQEIDDSAFEDTYISNNGAGYEGTLMLPASIPVSWFFQRI